MSFSIDLDRYNSFVEAKAVKNMRSIVAVSLQGIMSRNPVDTGRSRANWRVQAGKPDLETDDNVDAAATLNRGLGVAKALELRDKNIYISNNLPYAMRLEYGWSGQAPQGMVRVTAVEVLSLIAAGRLG